MQWKILQSRWLYEVWLICVKLSNLECIGHCQWDMMSHTCSLCCLLQGQTFHRGTEQSHFNNSLPSFQSLEKIRLDMQQLCLDNNSSNINRNGQAIIELVLPTHMSVKLSKQMLLTNLHPCSVQYVNIWCLLTLCYCLFNL